MTTGRINQIASSLRPDTIKNMTMLRFKEIHSSPLSFAIHSQPNSIDFSSSQLSSSFHSTVLLSPWRIFIRHWATTCISTRCDSFNGLAAWTTMPRQGETVRSLEHISQSKLTTCSLLNCLNKKKRQKKNLAKTYQMPVWKTGVGTHRSAETHLMNHSTAKAEGSSQEKKYFFLTSHRPHIYDMDEYSATSFFLQQAPC